ncbi:hypothetical protein GWI33_006022 [Rhynchophorus ferrugineus]|uniref:Uncharacterized protein n=1 Tax=Rhynchophorus ferrugineus TaxID=354439 RepID=A0A834MLK7_RHYFE|nr:hypothetical protein GWI33_006022 [Rhynchophorus ferrugineus]
MFNLSKSRGNAATHKRIRLSNRDGTMGRLNIFVNWARCQFLDSDLGQKSNNRRFFHVHEFISVDVSEATLQRSASENSTVLIILSPGIKIIIVLVKDTATVDPLSA